MEKQVDYETGELTVTEVHQRRAPLFAKLARAMGTLGRLPKNGHNAYHNYDYVTDGDVADSVRKALAGEGVAFFAEMLSTEKVGGNTVCHFLYTFADGESGETWQCQWWSEAADKTDKGISKAATSGLKYFLLKNFILSTGDVEDEPDAGPPPEVKKESDAANPPQKKMTASEFYALILHDYPYYAHINHIKNTLKQMGYTGYKASAIDEMIAKLSAHAAEKEKENDDV